MNKRTLVIFCLGWLTSLVLACCVAGHYYMEFQRLTKTLEKYESCIIHVNICINYKEWNNTIVWYNDTIVPLGCNLLDATKKVAVVNYTYWPAYQASFIDAINDVWNNNLYYWMWYRWVNDKWEYGHCGADLYILSEGEILMWQYEIPKYS
ncbi:MAG: hypothetical protein QW667_05055 [Candidatus Bathyarchaeia archaeon]